MHGMSGQRRAMHVHYMGRGSMYVMMTTYVLRYHVVVLSCNCELWLLALVSV
jgi:hypothetical protein